MHRKDAHAEVLNQALPYIQQFQGATFVVKYGGSALKETALVQGVVRNVLLLQLVGIRTVFVHGGGPEIDGWLNRLGIEKHVLDGLRVTDDDTMEVVEMALNKTNRSLVAEIQRAGGRAIGLSGRDADLLQARRISAELGRVGKVTTVAPEVLTAVQNEGFIPVVCSVASDEDRSALNVNADIAAGAIAAAVGATKLILLSDTNGVLDDPSDPDSTISILSREAARSMLADGRANRGMIPKLESAFLALEAGVQSVHILNGNTPNSLLVELFTDEGIGTMME